MMRRRALIAALMAVPEVELQAQPMRELHGAHDAWAGEGLALAWGVLRGPDEARTRVLIRIEADPKRWARLEASGIDPFGGTRTRLPMLQFDGGRWTVDVPRARFADHPRTELLLWAPGAAEPSLKVYFAGVPDTTPEHADAAGLDADLARRLARARLGR